MGLQTNVVRRAGSARYYARIGVPLDLQKLVGKKELWKSLGTADAHVARSRAAPVLADWHSEFSDLRRKRAPTEDDLQAVVWRHYQQEVEADRRERIGLPKADAVDAAKAAYAEDVRTGKARADDLGRIADVIAVSGAADFLKDSRVRRQRTLKRQIAAGETTPIEWAVDDVIEREGLLIQRGSEAYYDLAHRLQRAELEALKRGVERDEGEWAGRPGDPLVKAPTVTPATQAAATAKPGESIMELHARFAREKAGDANPDTWEQNRKIVGLFAEFVGESSSITAVSRRNVRDWKHALEKWPVKATERREFRGKPFKEVIAANVGLGKPTIHPLTVNRYLAALGAFGGWLLANDYIAENVSDGMYLSVDKSAGKRIPFTSEQLTTLFSSPLYTGFEGDGKEHKPGNHHADDWRTWLPLLGLFSGARLGELSQLLVDDVRKLHGRWIVHITEEGGEGKSTKNDGSMRVVPLHSELIRLGFLKYHARIAATGAKQLFPELTPDARGFRSGTPSSFFRRYIQRIGLKQGRGLTFHGFRHGFADALRRAGYLDEQFAFLLGHTKGSTTGRYGILPQGPLEQRVTMIEAVAFPGLDLTP